MMDGRQLEACICIQERKLLMGGLDHKQDI